MHRALILILLLLAPLARVPAMAASAPDTAPAEAHRCCPLCTCGDDCPCAMDAGDPLPTRNEPQAPAPARNELLAVLRAADLATSEHDQTRTPRPSAVRAAACRATPNARTQSLLSVWRT